ncbi:amidohydrolase family protein [Pendulispora rubella]|uniref:Amidohydrolase family protein n=1 Tax=Pendulispora rubella TaxID=2741070 RepID=A0ABZ2KVV4_9BACT
MRHLALVLLLSLTACGSKAPTPAASAPPAPSGPTFSPASFALVHATVVDVAHGTALPERTVVVDGDRIAAVTDEAPAGVRTVEARGKFVIPGLWDMHVHMNDPVAPRLFVANGVTAVRVMWGNPDFGGQKNRRHFDMRDAFDKKESLGPRMVVASQILDGPKPFWPGSTAVSTPEQGRRVVDEEKKNGADFIKVYSELPRDVYFAIAEESKKENIPFAGHVPMLVTAGEASDAGQKSIEHLTGMLSSTSSHEAAMRKKAAQYEKRSAAERYKLFLAQLGEAVDTYDAEKAKSLFAKFVTNGTWQCPTLIEEYGHASQDDTSRAKDPRLEYVSGFVKEMWTPRQAPGSKGFTKADHALFRRAFDKKVAMVGAMHAAGVSLLAGSDEMNPYCFAGSGLHDELAWLVKAGLTPADALRAATTNPARFLGRENELGEVAEGKVGDLVVLDENPLADIENIRKIHAVISRGTLYDRAELDKILASVKEDAKKHD